MSVHHPGVINAREGESKGVPSLEESTDLMNAEKMQQFQTSEEGKVANTQTEDTYLHNNNKMYPRSV